MKLLSLMIFCVGCTHAVPAMHQAAPRRGAIAPAAIPSCNDAMHLIGKDGIDHVLAKSEQPVGCPYSFTYDGNVYVLVDEDATHQTLRYHAR